nr:RNA-dependent RNA polymerase [Mute swan feces associated picobirnavirus 3]
MNNKYRRFLDTLNLDKDVVSQISRLLERVDFGEDKKLITPVGEDVGPENILSQWDEIYNSKLHLIDVPLQGLELSNRSKYGPRSIAVPWVDRKDAVLDYFSPDNTKEIRHRSNLGNRLRPLSVPNASKYLKNTTNSGLPFYQKKGRVKEETVSKLNALLQRRDPCVMFTRTQEGMKTRTVWGYPIADTLLEMQYYRPLLEYQSRQDWRSSVTTPSNVDNKVIKLMNQARANDQYLVSIDFSAYDASIKRRLIESAFVYIKSAFQQSNHEVLDYIKERMITIGLITPDGILTGDHGVPSGSTFTNEVDSIVQYLIAREFTYEDLQNEQIQGDDGIYSTSYPEELLDHFRSYGLNVNDSKSYTSKEFCVFLQKYYSYDYIDEGIVGGIYPTYRALSKLVYPERFTDFKEELSGKDYFAIRTLSILENCKYHPLFRDLVEFVMSLDKFSLIPSDQGIRGYVKLREIQDGKDVNFEKHTYGDSTSIKDFETYKLVKELS